MVNQFKSMYNHYIYIYTKWYFCSNIIVDTTGVAK